MTINVKIAKNFVKKNILCIFKAFAIHIEYTLIGMKLIMGKYTTCKVFETETYLFCLSTLNV